METDNNPKKLPTEEKPEVAAAQKPPAESRYECERQQFRALILSNPNYFGNLKSSPFKQVLDIVGNTMYEDIGGVRAMSEPAQQIGISRGWQVAQDLRQVGWADLAGSTCAVR